MAKKVFNPFSKEWTEKPVLKPSVQESMLSGSVKKKDITSAVSLTPSVVITIGDSTVQDLLLQQSNPLELQEKLKALFSADIKTEDLFPINARDLHSFLGIGKKFTDWIKDSTDKYSFIESQDFEIRFPKSGSGSLGGQNKTDYYFTVDAAKELAMVQKSDLGKLVRRYLIWAEKKLREVTAVISQEQKLPAMSTMEMISTIALHVDKVEKEQKRQADILQQQQEQQQEIAAAVEEQTVRLNRLEQNTVTIRNFAPPDEDVKKSINDRVKALAFNRKEKEGGVIKTHVTDIWSDIYRELRSLGYDLDEELASFKDFWTSQKNRGNKMFTQGKINGFNRLDVVSAVPDIRSMVRTILDRLQDDLEKAEDNGLY